MGWFSFSRKDKQTSAQAEGAYVARSDDSGARSRGKRGSAKTANEPVDPVLPEKKRARRRLVGAIALALAVIIGLPMVLDSEPKPLAGDIAIQIPSKDKPYSAGEAAARPRSSVPAEQALDQGEELVDMPKPGASSTSASASAAAAQGAASHAGKPSASARAVTQLPANGDATAALAAPGLAKPAETKPAEHKSAEQKAAEQKAAERKAAEQKAAEHKAAEAKAAEAREAKAAEAREAKAAEARAESKPAGKPAEAKPAEHKPESKPAKPETRAEHKPDARPVEQNAADSKTPARADTDAERAKALLDGHADAGKSEAKAEAKPTRFVVQVAALASQEKIDELQGKLRAAGISSHTQKVATDSGPRTRIRVGPFADKEEAARMRDKLVKLGLSGTLIPQ